MAHRRMYASYNVWHIMPYFARLQNLKISLVRILLDHFDLFGWTHFLFLGRDIRGIQLVENLNSNSSPDFSGPFLIYLGGHALSTFVHPDISVELARWLDTSFAFFMKQLVQRFLSGNLTRGVFESERAIVVDLTLVWTYNPYIHCF
eukprot:NODE_701_length_5037_cov_0.452318.p5 type:complete len:147 gc:universal NODE_701_length_5037_cov_0.452318:2181-1741(-)